MRLIRKSEINKPEITYNLHIKDNHNYIVEGAVVANCHSAKATILRSLLTQSLKNAPIRWGLTGTMPKDKCDAESIITSIGPVIGGIKAHDLQERGILSKCHVHVIQLVDRGIYANYGDESKYLVTDPDRIQYICSMISKISNCGGNTLILVNRRATGQLLQQILSSNFDEKDINFVSGTTKTKVRQADYDDFKVQDNKITIATYGVAAVGINIVRIHNLIVIEPGKSFVRVIQSIGRGLRKGADKDHVDIYDITSTLKYSKRHLKERQDFYKESEYPFTVQKINWREE